MKSLGCLRRTARDEGMTLPAGGQARAPIIGYFRPSKIALRLKISL
jgi:hypothetical protein